MTWALTGSKAALEMIAACNRVRLSGMIERIPASKPHRIAGQVIDALDLRCFQNAQCTEAHGAKPNDGNDTRLPAKSPGASALLACSCVGVRALQALWALLLEAIPLDEPLTANWSVTQRVSRDRRARRRRGAHAQRRLGKSPVIRLSLKNRRRAF
jgi:hypothetical protein